MKRLCLCKETKAQTSAVPLFLPGRKVPATQKLPGNGGVRRGLLSFSPQLQGDFPCPLPSALHQTAALFASRGRVLVLFRAFCICVPYSIRFLRGCQGAFLPITDQFSAKHPGTSPARGTPAPAAPRWRGGRTAAAGRGGTVPPGRGPPFWPRTPYLPEGGGR